ncbi:MAG TPA: aminomethyl-transferring glycine dehydrogenase subunit GcvPB [bacterium]
MQFPGTTGFNFNEPLIFDRSKNGKTGCSLPEIDLPQVEPESVIPKELLRDKDSNLPEVSELDVVRHYVRLSQWNYCVDAGFYPLGSCTMKYNPKVNEAIFSDKGFTELHPLAPEDFSQGALQVIYELGEYLKEISGMYDVALSPFAGAHGELAGMMIVKAYFQSRGENRKKILIPDSAHGTNPASSAMCGFEVVKVGTADGGILAPETIARMMNEDVAAIMLTNPNTLGLFEKNIKEVGDIVHSKGGLVYCDGANLNALMGIVKPGNLGINLLQFNLHKTFSTPHGGGGPGGGGLAVSRNLAEFLPVPSVIKKGKKYIFDYRRKKSIGRISAFWGNFLVMARAYAYIRSLGPDGLRRVSELAVLNANYARAKLRGHYDIPYDTACMHEVILSDKKQKEKGIITMDIAKRLMDYGFHPPTIYFPLIVPGAMMIEPTETESKQTLDSFINAMIAIAKEAIENPGLGKSAPHITRLKRLDETKAAREPALTCVK